MRRQPAQKFQRNIEIISCQEPPNNSVGQWLLINDITLLKLFVLNDLISIQEKSS